VTQGDTGIGVDVPHTSDTADGIGEALDAAITPSDWRALGRGAAHAVMIALGGCLDL
jgi:hypothetical protein